MKLISVIAFYLTIVSVAGQDRSYRFAKEGECASGNEFKIEGIGLNATQACANACYNKKMDGVPVLGFVIAPDHEDTCWCETAVSTCTVNNVNTYVRYDLVGHAPANGELAAAVNRCLDLDATGNTCPDEYGPMGTWDVSQVIDFSYLFQQKSQFNANIGNWDTSSVKSMYAMFYKASSFNQNIGAWHTSSVTDMSYMFDKASSFKQNIGGWNTSSVTDMSHMFYLTTFNQNIGAWDTSSVTDMAYMFRESPFNQNIGGWNTSKVTNMYKMFYQTPFNQDIGAWDTSSVTDMSYMFYQTPFNQYIGSWDTSSVTDMSYMFQSATKFNQDLSCWDLSKARSYDNFAPALDKCKRPPFDGVPEGCTGCSRWFYSREELAAAVDNCLSEDPTGVDCPSYHPMDTWDVSQVTDFLGLFKQKNQFNASIGNWDTSSVTTMVDMFSQATAFNQDIGAWDTSSVTDAKYMFYFASSFNQDIGGWNTSKVTNMNRMFYETPFNQDIGAWDTGKVKNTWYMFSNSPFNQDIGNWDTSSVQSMSHMFYNAISFDQDLSRWDISDVQTHTDFAPDLDECKQPHFDGPPEGCKCRSTGSPVGCDECDPMFVGDGRECIPKTSVDQLEIRDLVHLYKQKSSC